MLDWRITLRVIRLGIFLISGLLALVQLEAIYAQQTERKHSIVLGLLATLFEFGED